MVAGAAFLAGSATAAEKIPPARWPDFRGPNWNGHAGPTPLPLRWSETENVLWKVPTPGRGWSSPVVWDNQIWFTTATEDGREMSVLCYDLQSGKNLHQRLLFTNEKVEAIGPGKEANTYASPSPVMEAGRVYVHFGNYGTACIDTKSFKTVWERRDINCLHFVGPGSSPFLYKNLLILTMDGTDRQYVVALDKKTGKEVWQTKRSVYFGDPDPNNAFAIPDQSKAFSTPIVTEFEGKPMLVSIGAKAAYGYEALTGKELWRVGYPGFSNAARPVVGHGLAYIVTGYGKADLFAVPLNSKGDVTNALAWKYTRNVPLNPTPLLIDDRLYLLHGSGVFTCLDAKTGAELWKDRVAPNAYSASPIYGGGHIYCFGDRGLTTVLKPGESFQKIAENTLEEGTMATPAAAGNRLVLRAKSHLYCLGSKQL